MGHAQHCMVPSDTALAQRSSTLELLFWNSVSQARTFLPKHSLAWEKKAEVESGRFFTQQKGLPGGLGTGVMGLLFLTPNQTLGTALAVQICYMPGILRLSTTKSITSASAFFACM